MATGHDRGKAAGTIPRRLFHYNAGFLRDARLRRILALAGHELHLALPGRGPKPGDGVAVWGRSPYAHRGEAASARHSLPLIRLEDAFLRSIRPGRAGDTPIGLMIDPTGGVHFDSAAPSALERLLATHPLDDSNLLQRARDGIARLQALDLSKYNMHLPDAPLPAPGYVLVVDQTRGDASIRHGGASESTFAEMLDAAMAEHPAARIVIKTHPETAQGLRAGHFAPVADPRVTLVADPVSPWRMVEGAVAVYTVSSQLGFEAVLAGHRPQVFGQPWYAGWGLTGDRNPIARRRRSLTRTQAFAAAMILAPAWYDPCRDRLCDFEEAIDQMEAEVRAFREDRAGHVAVGMRLWKRRRIADIFGGGRGVVFTDDPARAAARATREGRGLLVWASQEVPELSAQPRRGGERVAADQGTRNQIPTGSGKAEQGEAARNTTSGQNLATAVARDRSQGQEHRTTDLTCRQARNIGPRPGVPPVLRRVEDGFLRSRGLGAELVPPISLFADDLGIYYDPSRESRLERQILAPLPAGGHQRATRLIARLIAGGVSKYNLGGALPDLPPGRRILVPGQVEDDASIRLGGGEVRTNVALLRAARAANPDAVLVYKPHPDVETGLRPGAIAAGDLAGLADVTAHHADPAALIAATDEVWTITSLLGFEALLRGRTVTCLGAPFYAGWGLTRDLGPVPERRLRAPDGHPLPRPDLARLAHAALIACPRYWDPVSRRPCPPEVALDRLAGGEIPHPGPALRLLAKLQGLFAGHAALWR